MTNATTTETTGTYRERTLWVGTIEDCGGDLAPSHDEWDRYVELVSEAVGEGVEVIEGSRPGGGLTALAVRADGRDDDTEAQRLASVAQSVWDGGEWVDAEEETAPMAVADIHDLLEERGVSASAFWQHAMGGDRAALPREDVERCIREVQGIARYTVTISEDGDQGARWLYGIEAGSPKDAVEPALREARQHGYPLGRAHVQVWDSSVQGAMYGHTPLHEQMVEE